MEDNYNEEDYVRISRESYDKMKEMIENYEDGKIVFELTSAGGWDSYRSVSEVYESEILEKIEEWKQEEHSNAVKAFNENVKLKEENSQLIFEIKNLKYEKGNLSNRLKLINFYVDIFLESSWIDYFTFKKYFRTIKENNGMSAEWINKRNEIYTYTED